MINVAVSVPGKVILSGDHAVVYGRPAMVAAINKRLTVELRITNDELRINNEYIHHCVDMVCKKYGIEKMPRVDISITSEILEGYHVGSSAAVAVGVIAALTYYLKNIWNPVLTNQLAYEAEKFMHGTPSGVDNTAVAMGGFIWYRKELEFLKSIWQLPVKLSKNLDHFYLIDTGKPAESTKEMISYVRMNYELRMTNYEKIFHENEMFTKQMAVAIKEESEADLIYALRGTSKTLSDMGVVSDSAGSIVRSIELSGGAAKILGGGGKKGPVGYLLCYHPNKEKLTAVCKKLSLPFFPVTLGAEGVRLEKN